MVDTIQGRTIGQLPNLTASQVDRLNDLIAIWRAGQPDGNRTGAITPAELQALVSQGLLDKAEADLLYAPLGSVAGDVAVRIPFSFGDATPKVLGSFGPGLLSRVSIVIETAFNAPSGLSIGTAAQPDLYLPTAMNDPLSINEYEVTPDIFLASATEFVLAIAPGVGITQGKGHVIIQVYP